MKYAFLVGVSIVLALPGLGFALIAQPSDDPTWESPPLPPLPPVVDVVEAQQSSVGELISDLAALPMPVVEPDAVNVDVDGGILDALALSEVDGIVEPQDGNPANGLTADQLHDLLLPPIQTGPCTGCSNPCPACQANIGQCPNVPCVPCGWECPQIIPEPATVALLGFGSLLILRRRTA